MSMEDYNFQKARSFWGDYPRTPSHHEIVAMLEEEWKARLQHCVEKEREACIEIVEFHGGSVEILAAIRARGNK